jgi:hypothetical protein
LLSELIWEIGVMLSVAINVSSPFNSWTGEDARPPTSF